MTNNAAALKKVAFFGYGVLLLVASVTPQTGEATFHGLDKMLHLLAYTLFMVIGAAAFERALWPRVALGLFIFGIAVEGIQGLVPTRDLSFADHIANSMGIAVGYYLALLRARPTHRELARQADTGRD